MATTEAVPIMTSGVITSDPELRGGVPCFAGTRVDVKTFFDHIEGDYSVDEFLAQYPSITREQVATLLRECLEAAERSARHVGP